MFLISIENGYITINIKINYSLPASDFSILRLLSRPNAVGQSAALSALERSWLWQEVGGSKQLRIVSGHAEWDFTTLIPWNMYMNHNE